MFAVEFFSRMAATPPVVDTSNLAAGASDPMPTLPPSSTVSRVPPALLRYRFLSL